jgi:sec-independent protein translocase protein TatA
MLSPLAFLNGETAMIILIVVVLLFGGSKLPELARGMGKAKREFKKASEEVEDEERARIRVKLEEEERAKRAQDGKQN